VWSTPDFYLGNQVVSMDSTVDIHAGKSDVSSMPLTNNDGENYDRQEIGCKSSILPTSINEKQRLKYFGREAKANFYKTYRELNKRGNICHGGFSELDEHVKDQSTSNFHHTVKSLYSSGVLTPPIPKLRPRTASALESKSKVRSDSTCNSYNSIIDVEPMGSNLARDSISSWGIPVSVDNKSSNISIEEPSPSLSNLRSLSLGEFNLESQDDNSETEAKKLQRHKNKSRISKSFSENSVPRLNIDDDNASQTSLEMFSTYEPQSPRAIFLVGCLRNNIPPRTAAVIRDKISNRMNLSHLGLGDTLGQLLARSLAGLPNLEVLILEDNNLGDVGLTDILNSIRSHNKITELDISSNKIDDGASAALGNLIKSPNCSLLKLRLSNADVDDGECSAFVSCLMQNTRLQVRCYYSFITW